MATKRPAQAASTADAPQTASDPSRKKRRTAGTITSQATTQDNPLETVTTSNLAVSELNSNTLHTSIPEAEPSQQKSTKRKRKQHREDISNTGPVNGHAVPSSTYGVAETTVQAESNEQKPAKTARSRKRRKLGTAAEIVEEGGSIAPTPDAVTKLSTGERDTKRRKKITAAIGIAKSNKDKAKARRNRKHKGQFSENSTADDTWTQRLEVAGHFLDQDPILTSDKQHVILPTSAAVHVYSARTSLLVRQLRIDDAVVTSCYLSRTKSTHLYMSSSGKQSLTLWDWTTGQVLGRWYAGRRLLRIMGLAPAKDRTYESVVVLKAGEKGHQQVMMVSLADSANESPISKLLLSRKFMLREACVSLDGKTLVLCSDNHLLLGLGSDSSDVNMTYEWHELTLQGPITCVDARYRAIKRNKKDELAMDVAVGFSTGVISIYEDIQYQTVLRSKERTQNDVSSRRLHWHRGPVNTVKWSDDMNYLISGGDETVLVIWQLDTNQQQFLPHLTTPIMNLSVSASSYTIRLADNSVMVIQIADLLPSTNIAGLAVNGHRSFPTAMHPKHQNHLISTGTAQASSRDAGTIDSTATLLQTYDISSNVQLNRQALTRNIVTIVNVSAKGGKIAEPDVKFLCITHDGNWLVTLDQWCAPDVDLDPLYPASLRDSHLKNRKTETYLRFWLWNQNAQTWEVVTRVNNPHNDDEVLDLVVSPTRLEVATASSDGSVHFWSPRSRVRNGLPVADASGVQLYTWTASRIIDVQGMPQSIGVNTSATLAYSDDGSVLAASWSEQQRITHLVDVMEGKPVLSLPNLLAAGEARLAFAQKHLLCLSTSQFCVYDTVKLTNVFTIKLSPQFSSKRQGAGFLASNTHDGTFALLLNAKPSGRGFKIAKSAQLTIFNANDLAAGAIHQATLSHPATNLLARLRGPGYVVIDSEAQVIAISPFTTGASLTTATAGIRQEPDDVKKGLDAIFGPLQLQRGQVAEGQGTANGVKLLTEAEDQDAVFSGMDGAGKESLTSIFSSLAGESPSRKSMREIFERVALSVIGK